MNGPLDSVAEIDKLYGRDPRLFAMLHPHLSAGAVVQCQIEVELALLRGFAHRGLLDAGAVEAFALSAREISAADVADREATTRHDIVALRQLMQEHAPPPIRPLVHLGATSQDIVDTANACRYRRFVTRELVPCLRRVDRRYSGEADAANESTLASRVRVLLAASERLRGKLSGAVGTYASFALLFADARGFERSVLASLDLEPAVPATQIVPGEQWVDLGHAVVTALAALVNLATRAAPDVAPTIHALWLGYAPRMMTMLSDQISEHQRDLTNSASQRFTNELLAALAIAAELLDRIDTGRPS